MRQRQNASRDQERNNSIPFSKSEIAQILRGIGSPQLRRNFILMGASNARSAKFQNPTRRGCARHLHSSMKNVCQIQSILSCRQRMISLPMIEAILENCPNHEWRAIFALCRYAGLRCPSEFVGLTWADVDWERGALRVKSPKTEHHPGHESRLVPVVPALRRVLEDCFEAAPVGSVLIVPRLRSSRSNLRTHAVRIIEKAGVQPWPKIFQNMRSSCETAWLEQYPVASVAGWLGHSREVCMKHYAQVLPEHFESAVNGDREKAAHFAAQQVAAGGVFRVAASRTTKNSDDENALEKKAFQAVEENNEETKNRGDTIRTCGLYVPNVAL